MAVWSNVNITNAGKKALHNVSMGVGRLQVTGAAAFVNGTKIQDFKSVTLKQDSESEGIYVLRLVLDSAYGLAVLGTKSYMLKDICIFATYFEKSAESGLEDETQITFATVSANSGDEIEVDLSDDLSTLITYTFRLEIEDGVTEFGFTSLDSTEVGIATEAYVDDATKSCLRAVVVDEPPVYSEYISNGIEGFEVLNNNAVVSFDSSTGFVATTRANMGTDVDGGSVALNIPDKFLGVESLTVGFDMVWCGDNHMFLALADSSVHVAPYRAVGTDEHTAQDFDMEKGILSSFGYKRRRYFLNKAVTPTLSAFYTSSEDAEDKKVHVEWRVNKKTNTGTLTLKTLGEGPSQILTDNFTYSGLTPNSIFLYLGFVGAKVIINNLTIAGSGFVDNMVYVVGEGIDKKIYLAKKGKLTEITDPAPTFTEAAIRSNIESGTLLSTILGKIKKWFSDLHAVAFTGSYTSLVNKPENATTNSRGFMSPADKAKLDGIAEGAQKNSITGVKGDSEVSYRTGKVNITKANIGLGNVDNTSDVDKPISTAQQTALDGKAPISHLSDKSNPHGVRFNQTVVQLETGADLNDIPDGMYLFPRGTVNAPFNGTGLLLQSGYADIKFQMAVNTYRYQIETYYRTKDPVDGWHEWCSSLVSPQFTGVPTSPTAEQGTNTKQIANTEFVQNVVQNAVNGRTPYYTYNGVSLDFNDLTQIGFHVIQNVGESTLNCPETPDRGTLLCIHHNNMFGVQLWFHHYESYFWIRHRYNGTWQAWKRVDNPDSPAFTGIPTAPTAESGTSTAQIATTEFVHNAIKEDWQYVTGTGVTLWRASGAIKSSFEEISNFNNAYITFRYGGSIQVGFTTLGVSTSSFSAEAYVKIYKNGVEVWKGTITRQSATITDMLVERGDTLTFEYGFENPTETFRENTCGVYIHADLEHIGFDSNVEE